MNYMAKAQHSSSVLSHATSSVLLRDLFDHSLSQFISEAASGCSEEVVSLAVSAATAHAFIVLRRSCIEIGRECGLEYSCVVSRVVYAARQLQQPLHVVTLQGDNLPSEYRKVEGSFLSLTSRYLLTHIGVFVLR